MSGLDITVERLSAQNTEATTTPGSTTDTSTPATSITGLDVEKLAKSEDTKRIPSYQSIFNSPPPIKYPYRPNEALGDIPGISYALELFLASHMVESEDYCNKSDVNKLAGYVVSSLNTTGVGFIRSMTDVERHAELVYAESLFEKALLGIVYSGDWLAFIKETLNMRTTIQVYRTLHKYINTMDADFTFDGVDVTMAQKIINWNLKRYPDGVFFLFGAGRASLAKSQPLRAIGYYTRAMEVQAQYRNLHHISYWEIAIARMALWHIRGSLEAWEVLQVEATWSKSIYSYGMAVGLLELADALERGELESEPKANITNEKARTPAKMREEATKLMEKVPGLRQKIAGKSIPLEKFVARKARKYISQDRRLALPMLELAYLALAIAHAPMNVVETSMIPEDPDAELDPAQLPNIPRDQAAKEAKAAFHAVLEHGPKIDFDHQLVYQAHYEIGRLLACQDDTAGATKHFDLVLSGKYLEVGPSGRKGKYSLENALHMRTHAALEALHQKRL
ncbi:hypothetical protein HHX47_DHR10000365 [Lentinula edodes]|nr:hypothetical protein HHX47_DHR10000365 [Lentinula edodes]